MDEATEPKNTPEKSSEKTDENITFRIDDQNMSQALAAISKTRCRMCYMEGKADAYMFTIITMILALVIVRFMNVSK